MYLSFSFSLSSDAQKLVKKKQMRTDGGCRNLQLHNVCIIWHDSASEVLLVGSVDGWTTQVIVLFLEQTHALCGPR
ncbi:hypothetical protein Hdeb2414_s0095g00791901 [Helianthus debilis subsp. tardiflorus]